MNKSDLAKFFVLIFILSIDLNCFAKKDSLFTNFFSRIYPGIYIMPNVAPAYNKLIYNDQLNPSKIAGYGGIYGINSEIKLSDRRSIRIGILHAVITNYFMLFPENIYGSPLYGNSVFLGVNSSGFQFPLEFKYTLIKSTKRGKIKPYILAGITKVFIYHQKYIYKNNGGSIDDHTEIIKAPTYPIRPILTIGCNYNISKKMNLYIEPFYKYQGAKYFYTSKSFGLAVGLNINL